MQSSSPQLEDGYIRIANELYDAILAYPFTGRQLKVLLAILRKTYGYGKKVDDMSASQIGDLCGLERTHVTATLNQLAGMSVIAKSAGVYGSVVGINKDHKSWILDRTESVQVDQNGTRTKTVQGVPKLSFARTESVRVDRTKSVHTKDNLPKDNQQKKSTCANADAFARFWAAYPKRKSRAQAEKAFAKIDPSEQLMATIIEAIERAKTSEDWRKAKGQFVPYPATWLNARGWEDEGQDQVAQEVVPEQAHIPHGGFAMTDGRYRLNGVAYDRHGKREVAL
jgi:phage replication O-like protein O